MSDLKENFPDIWEMCHEDEELEEMRDGLPPKDPGREGKGKGYHSQAASKNLAQANKKYTAEEENPENKKMSIYRKALTFNESIK